MIGTSNSIGYTQRAVTWCKAAWSILRTHPLAANRKWLK